jgi:hypothetical protein
MKFWFFFVFVVLSRRHYLEAPPHNSNDSDDAGSRESTFKDMDFHRFHPVFYATTPRRGYVIPPFGNNSRFAERISHGHNDAPERLIRVQVAVRAPSAAEPNSFDRPW